VKKNLLVPCLIPIIVLVSGFAHAADVKGTYKQANKLFANGKYAEALPLYQAVLATKPSSEISASVLYTRIADSYFHLENYKNARDAYRAALQGQKQSERPPTQYWIGFCTFLMGNDADAVDEYLKIPRLYPDAGMWVSTAYYEVGRVYKRMGKKELAAEYYRKAAGNGKSTEGRFALKQAEQLKSK
jgi:tetratricopeptide (TPR) repeat protein